MTTAQKFPGLDSRAIIETRAAVHAYARVLGDWLKSCRRKRKHWWHARLRPSLTGLTTGVANARIDFELQLNLRENQLYGRTSDGAKLAEVLQGQPASKLARSIAD